MKRIKNIKRKDMELRDYTRLTQKKILLEKDCKNEKDNLVKICENLVVNRVHRGGGN